jgi:hypothetical protein
MFKNHDEMLTERAGKIREEGQRMVIDRFGMFGEASFQAV